MRCFLWLAMALMATCGSLAAAQTAGTETVYSGPQANEKLASFQVRGVVGEQAGKTFDPVELSAGKPLVLVFVNQVTRPSIGLTRTLMNYVTKRSQDGLRGGVVFLSKDSTETANWMKRAEHALPRGVPLGISLDGGEGPGAYGLNRNVTLTVLVAKENQVTANFALVQPSLQADARRIAAAMVKTLGEEKAPSLAELGVAPERSMRDPNLRPLLAPVIRKTATAEEVDAAAAKVEAYAAKNRRARQQVGSIARRIIQAGRLDRYGSARAQRYLQKWAKEYGGLNPPAPNASKTREKKHEE